MSEQSEQHPQDPHSQLQHSHNHLPSINPYFRELAVLAQRHQDRPTQAHQQRQHHSDDRLPEHLQHSRGNKDQTQSRIQITAHAQEDPHGHDKVNLHCQNCAHFKVPWQHLDCVSQYHIHWMATHHIGQFIFVCSEQDYFPSRKRP